jgi:hypothetical protein
MGAVRNANLVRGAANLGANGLVRGVAGLAGLTPVGIGIDQAINLAFPPDAKGELPVGTRGADGKFWTGSDYGWQSGASAVKAGLLPSEVVGSTATGQAFGEEKSRGSLRNYGSDYKEEELKAGRQAEQFRAGAGFPGQQLTGGAQPPGSGLGNAAVVSTYDMTPQGQFQRYFTDNQMGRYFGGAPSAQAPQSAEAMQEAAMLQKAPTTMPLADYYRSQSATGRANMDQIVGLMGYTGDMEKWARANPMLAQRAFAQQFQGGGPATLGNPDAVPVPDEALNPAGPEFSGVGGTGERIYNFAADGVTSEKIKAFQDLLKTKSAQ